MKSPLRVRGLAALILFIFALGQPAAAADHSAVAPLPPVRPPTFADVHYGPFERNVLDFWQAKSDAPTPLFVFIHGGGWINGDKHNILIDAARVHTDYLEFMLAHGISVAAVNYRYSTIAPLPAPVHDAARAIQYLRSRAREWHLNPGRVAASGTSAGACTSLWLAFHADLADPKNADPVLRESTRLCAAVGFIPQTSIDPAVIVGWIGDQVANHPMIAQSVGAPDRADVQAHYARYQALFREFSPINHVTRDDPPVMVVYPHVGPLPALTQGAAIHHAEYGLRLKAKADAVGAVCLVRIEDQPETTKLSADQFLLDHLTAATP